ncbi:MAG: hypothetical protein PW788_09735 [Micavibrio sp.]|nr:hypothetical protein [Micavibrio sp.]
MASNSKSGLSSVQREVALRDLGFEKQRNGKGSHVVWEHTALKAMAQTGKKVCCPPNLLSNPAQAPWETTLPDNPGSGTWQSMLKHAKWAQQTVDDYKSATAVQEARKSIILEFREARDEVCAWKHETRHRLKSHLDATAPPQSYHEMPRIESAFLRVREERIAEQVKLRAKRDCCGPTSKR